MIIYKNTVTHHFIYLAIVEINERGKNKTHHLLELICHPALMNKQPHRQFSGL